MNRILNIMRDGRVVSTLEPENGTYKIGRDPAADIVLADAAVSKNHATLILADGMVSIKDNDSANGIFLKGKKISEHSFSGGFEFEIKPFVIKSADAEIPDVETGPGKSTGSIPRLRLTNIKASVFALVVAVMLGTLLIGYLPLKKQVGAIHRREVLKNGIMIGRYLAEMNRPALAKKQPGQTRISPIQKEDGVIYAFVVDPHGRIIAPQEKQGDFFNWKGLAAALQGGRLSIDDGPRNEKIIFYPVSQGNQTLGAAIIGYAHARVAETTIPGFGAIGYVLLAVLLCISMGIAHLLVRAFLDPLRQLHEEMEVAIKEGRGRLDFSPPYPEIDNIKRTFERLLMRKAAYAETGTPPSPPHPAGEAESAEAGVHGPAPLLPDISAHPPGPQGESIEQRLQGVTVPWCVIDRENYTLRRLSNNFAQTTGVAGCKEGLHVIEAFDTDMIQVVSQLMDASADQEITIDHPDGKHRLRRVSNPADPNHIALIFEVKT